MKKLTHFELVEALAKYGYPLSRPTHEDYSPNVLLSSLVKEDDVRLLEGFPVAYLNSLNDPKWKSYRAHLDTNLSKEDKKKFALLLMLSYLLFKLYGESKDKLNETKNVLDQLSGDWKESLGELEKVFNRSESLKLSDKVSLSTDRLKNQYRNYVLHPMDKASDESKMSMNVEALLSELFTMKQKALLKKRLNGQKLTKTEREYYYRVVNKRVKVLANDAVHAFAKSANTER